MSSVYHAHPAPPMSKTARALTLMGVLAIFQVTQSLVSTRPEPPSVQDGDQLLVALSPISDWFWARPDAVRWLLIFTSALVDICGVGILVFGALGPSTRPIIAITFICFMRQLCVVLIAIPTPRHTMFVETGVPSALVTYKTANDFFFSGHTAITAYAVVEFPRMVDNKTPGGVARRLAVRLLLTANCILQMFTVLVLRAHYSMDVVAGWMSALAADWAAVHAQEMIDSIFVLKEYRHLKRGESHHNVAVAKTE